jgi:hypothetical protein
VAYCFSNQLSGHTCEICLPACVSVNKINWIVFCFHPLQCHLSMQLHIAVTWFLFCSLKKIIFYLKIAFPVAVTFGHLWYKICLTIYTYLHLAQVSQFELWNVLSLMKLKCKLFHFPCLNQWMHVILIKIVCIVWFEL